MLSTLHRPLNYYGALPSARPSGARVNSVRVSTQMVLPGGLGTHMATLNGHSAAGSGPDMNAIRGLLNSPQGGTIIVQTQHQVPVAGIVPLGLKFSKKGKNPKTAMVIDKWAITASPQIPLPRQGLDRGNAYTL